MHRVNINPLIYRSWCEDSPGTRPQVPSQENMTFDVGHCEIVTSLPHGSLLTHEEQKSHLIDYVGGEVKLCLEEHVDIGWSLECEEGRVSSNPARE